MSPSDFVDSCLADAFLPSLLSADLLIILAVLEREIEKPAVKDRGLAVLSTVQITQRLSLLQDSPCRL